MGDAEYIEKFDHVGDMKPGDVAVTIDRERLLVCAYLPDKNSNGTVIIDLKDLQDQYLHNLKPKDRIRFLAKGDKYVVTA